MNLAHVCVGALLAAGVMSVHAGSISSETQSPRDGLTVAATIALPGVNGRIDHLAVDPSGRRLFVAALGNNTVEAVDLDRRLVTGRIQGLHHPQGLGYIAQTKTLVVAQEGDPLVRFYDGETLAVGHEIRLGDDCDNVRIDSTAGRVYVGYGDGAIAGLDGATRKVLDVGVGGHPESFQLEPDGSRIFVNVPDRGEVVVVDRAKADVVARWKVSAAAACFPMALDAAGHRLFIGCRRPARLLALDTRSGALTGQTEIVSDTDDLFYDAPTASVYAIGGGGAITTVATANGLQVTGRTETRPGARTGLLVGATRALVVAAPLRDGQPAELLVYQIPGVTRR